MLTQRGINEFRRKLENRFLVIRESIRQALLETEEQSYSELAGRVDDLQDAPLTDLLVDVSLAEIDHFVEQIRDIDASLLRIAHSSYGVCTDCGSEIEVGRLRAYPTAKRCLARQMIHEKRGRAPQRNITLRAIPLENRSRVHLAFTHQRPVGHGTATVRKVHAIPGYRRSYPVSDRPLTNRTLTIIKR
jgi:DnaK suppressor protein